MTPKEAITAIRQLLKGAFSDTPPAALETVKLSDGTLILVSGLEAGADIFIPTSEGNQEPAPAGNYELEDGRVLSVSDAGKIAEIKDTSKEKNPPTPAPVLQEMSSVSTNNESINEMKTLFLSQEKKITDLQKQLESFRLSTGKTFSAFLSILETDTIPPITQPKQTMFSTNIQAKETAKLKFLSALSELNKRGK